MNNFRFDEIFPLQTLFQSFLLWPVIDGFFSDLLKEVEQDFFLANLGLL